MLFFLFILKILQFTKILTRLALCLLSEMVYVLKKPNTNFRKGGPVFIYSDLDQQLIGVEFAYLFSQR